MGNLKRLSIQHKSKQHEVRYLQRLDEGCGKHKDVFRNISVPGARGSSTFVHRFRVDKEPVFCHVKHGECMRAVSCKWD